MRKCTLHVSRNWHFHLPISLEEKLISPVHWVDTRTVSLYEWAVLAAHDSRGKFSECSFAQVNVVIHSDACLRLWEEKGKRFYRERERERETVVQ